MHPRSAFRWCLPRSETVTLCKQSDIETKIPKKWQETFIKVQAFYFDTVPNRLPSSQKKEANSIWVDNQRKSFKAFKIKQQVQVGRLQTGCEEHLKALKCIHDITQSQINQLLTITPEFFKKQNSTYFQKWQQIFVEVRDFYLAAVPNRLPSKGEANNIWVKNQKTAFKVFKIKQQAKVGRLQVGCEEHQKALKCGHVITKAQIEQLLSITPNFFKKKTLIDAERWQQAFIQVRDFYFKTLPNRLPLRNEDNSIWVATQKTAFKAFKIKQQVQSGQLEVDCFQSQKSLKATQYITQAQIDQLLTITPDFFKEKTLIDAEKWQQTFVEVRDFYFNAVPTSRLPFPKEVNGQWVKNQKTAFKAFKIKQQVQTGQLQVECEEHQKALKCGQVITQSQIDQLLTLEQFQDWCSRFD